MKKQKKAAKIEELNQEALYGAGLEKLAQKIVTDLDKLMIEGLNRKGYSFKNNFDLKDFIRRNCKAERNELTKETFYYVNNVPFFYIKYKTDPVLINKENKRSVEISADYCYYSFL